MNELIERLKREAAFLDRSASMSEAHLKDLLRDCKEALQQSQWVSVEDESPELIQGAKILCHNRHYIFESEFDDEIWCNIGGDTFTHWMPLPKTPTKETQ